MNACEIKLVLHHCTFT